MEKIKEKYFKINGKIYSLELCGQKQFDMKTIPGPEELSEMSIQKRTKGNL